MRDNYDFQHVNRSYAYAFNLNKKNNRDDVCLMVSIAYPSENLSVHDFIFYIIFVKILSISYILSHNIKYNMKEKK